MSSTLPTTPTDGQIFVDSEMVKWVYNAGLDLWEKAGTTTGVPVATESSDGYMSYTDKQLLDSIPAVPGGFGIITDTKLLLQSESNPEGVISGDIQLLSDSIDIQCVDVNNTIIDYTPIDTGCPRQTNQRDFPGLSFRLSDRFLDSLIVNLPGNTGRKGKKGPKGVTGKPGFSGGPVGRTGVSGSNIDELAVLQNVKFNDIDGVTDNAIVRMQLIDTGSGCKLVLDKSKLNTPMSAPADKVIAKPTSPSLSFGASSNCATGMKDWKLSGNVNLVRLPVGAGEDTSAVGFNSAYNLSTFVTEIVAEYEKILKKIDQEYGKEAKEYVVGVDKRAREILNDLAGELTNCEFNLPAVEYCITFTGCDQPPASPENPSDPQPPEPPGPPGPPSASCGINTVPPNIYQFAEGSTIDFRVICNLVSPTVTWQITKSTADGEHADFNDFVGPTSGIVILDKGVGKFSIKLAKDVIIEKGEIFDVIVGDLSSPIARYGPITILEA